MKQQGGAPAPPSSFAWKGTLPGAGRSPVSLRRFQAWSSHRPRISGLPHPFTSGSSVAWVMAHSV